MNFSKTLLNWYNVNKRDLPWRGIDNPYVIWIAEVVFQQTRIEQGLPFFLRFIEKFPTVNDLACADEESVLKMWQGLGYYSRARNLHFSAKRVVNEMDGEFPVTYHELLKLKGVGPYIAAEVASVCSNEVIAAIDGNVQRVISRYFGVEEPVNEADGQGQIKALANAHISREFPGDFNQAVMDLGSSICVPRNPKCMECIFEESCWARRYGKQDVLPVKINKVKVRKRYFNYLLFVREGKLAMHKRAAGDVWQGLFQPVLLETSLPISSIEQIGYSGFLLASGLRQLSHQKLFLQFWVPDNSNSFQEEIYAWFDYSELLHLPVPKSIEELFCSHEFHELFKSVG